MDTLKQKVVEILKRDPELRGYPKTINAFTDQILALFSQSQAEQVKAIKGLDLTLPEINNGYFVIKRVLSILNQKRQ